MINHYQILGVSSNSSDLEIKKSYRKLALKYHPDKNREPGAEDKFKEISKSYDILSNPLEKAKYDKEFKVMNRGSSGGSNNNNNVNVKVNVNVNKSRTGASTTFSSTFASNYSSARDSPNTSPRDFGGTSSHRSTYTSTGVFTDSSTPIYHRRTDFNPKRNNHSSKESGSDKNESTENFFESTGSDYFDTLRAFENQKMKNFMSYPFRSHYTNYNNHPGLNSENKYHYSKYTENTYYPNVFKKNTDKYQKSKESPIEKEARRREEILRKFKNRKSGVYTFDVHDSDEANREFCEDSSSEKYNDFQGKGKAEDPIVLDDDDETSKNEEDFFKNENKNKNTRKKKNTDNIILDEDLCCGPEINFDTTNSSSKGKTNDFSKVDSNNGKHQTKDNEFNPSTNNPETPLGNESIRHPHLNPETSSPSAKLLEKLNEQMFKNARTSSNNNSRARNGFKNLSKSPHDRTTNYIKNKKFNSNNGELKSKSGRPFRTEAEDSQTVSSENDDDIEVLSSNNAKEKPKKTDNDESTNDYPDKKKPCTKSKPYDSFFQNKASAEATPSLKDFENVSPFRQTFGNFNLSSLFSGLFPESSNTNQQGQQQKEQQQKEQQEQQKKTGSYSFKYFSNANPASSQKTPGLTENAKLPHQPVNSIPSNQQRNNTINYDFSKEPPFKLTKDFLSPDTSAITLTAPVPPEIPQIRQGMLYEHEFRKYCEDFRKYEKEFIIYDSKITKYHMVRADATFKHLDSLFGLDPQEARSLGLTIPLEKLTDLQNVELYIQALKDDSDIKLKWKTDVEHHVLVVKQFYEIYLEFYSGHSRLM